MPNNYTSKLRLDYKAASFARVTSGELVIRIAESIRDRTMGEGSFPRLEVRTNFARFLHSNLVASIPVSERSLARSVCQCSLSIVASIR